MRILLDESVPEKLGKLLVGHSCSTVQRQGWASSKNGKLLALAKDHFDVLLSADKGTDRPTPAPITALVYVAQYPSARST